MTPTPESTHAVETRKDQEISRDDARAVAGGTLTGPELVAPEPVDQLKKRKRIQQSQES